MRNLHVPLPDSIYAGLRQESQRRGRPATEVAREAISLWLKAMRKAALRKELAAWIREFARTEHDLDPALERAGIEEMLRLGAEEK